MALTGWGRTVVENVAEVSVAASATDLGAYHSVGVIPKCAYVIRVKWLIEAWPTASGFELRPRMKERQCAQTAGVDAILRVVQQKTAERTLGTLVQNDASFFVAQRGSQSRFL